ncbi:hypothetical protein [Paenibacillus qinlingensis]|uniref:hypothetical protein n=1 Tax=Paenibacillus qinlingensis TaxID=1837343 RepID=UPI00286AD28F|nr:hypothetical protein [Paenibacillus qinlingensis]
MVIQHGDGDPGRGFGWRCEERQLEAREQQGRVHGFILPMDHPKLHPRSPTPY